jgi:hypothetical protein
MKEARANIRNSYRREVMSYLNDCMDYLSRKKKEDEAYIVEMIIDVIKETQPDKELVFDSKKLGY